MAVWRTALRAKTDEIRSLIQTTTPDSDRKSRASATTPVPTEKVSNQRQEKKGHAARKERALQKKCTPIATTAAASGELPPAAVAAVATGSPMTTLSPPSDAAQSVSLPSQAQPQPQMYAESTNRVSPPSSQQRVAKQQQQRVKWLEGVQIIPLSLEELLADTISRVSIEFAADVDAAWPFVRRPIELALSGKEVQKSPVLLLRGRRMIGKTTLARQVFGSRGMYFNLAAVLGRTVEEENRARSPPPSTPSATASHTVPSTYTGDYKSPAPNVNH
jgi:hypothetical protein